MVPCPRRPCDHRNMITLHYHPGNASFTPHVLLHEIGAPFELQLVDRAQGAHKSPAYLALNPNGLIPVLVDGDLVLYETAAIALHLCDTHPAAELAPALGTADRAPLHKGKGWGEDASDCPVAARALAFLEEAVGAAGPRRDVSLAEALAAVPASRLAGAAREPAIHVAADDRLRHARGQSLPDWVAVSYTHPTLPTSDLV